MKLLTKKNREDLPPIGGQEKAGEDAIAYVKFFTPFSNWTWFATEFDGDDLFFGLVRWRCAWACPASYDGFELELGYFSLSEFATVTGPFGAPGIERDLYFEPTKLSELREKAGRR